MTIYEVIYEKQILDIDDREELVECVKKGKVLETLKSRKGDICFQLIYDCLQQQPSERPDIMSILSTLKELCERIRSGEISVK